MGAHVISKSIVHPSHDNNKAVSLRDQHSQMYGLSLPENYSESNALNNLMVLHIHTDETDSLSKFSCKLIYR